MRIGIIITLLLVGLTAFAASAAGGDRDVDARFTQPADAVAAYDFVEVRIDLPASPARKPFTDVTVRGQFRPNDGNGAALDVDGFCDAADGRVHRVRFMPTRAGDYAYTVTARAGNGAEQTHTGTFSATDARRRGLVRVDPHHPYHFVWGGTGEHYFYNGTTTYWLLGWDDETMLRSIDRLADLKVNRLRVAICGRVKDGRAWFENVFPTEKFTFLLNPWLAQRPQSVEDPGFDVTRFNVSHWQKIERLLKHARERDVVVSIIFYVDGARPGVEPFKTERAGGDDEQRYYRYAAARLAPFSNVMWDVTNEYRLFRDDAWAEKMGAFLKKCDPYDHLISVHGHGDYRFRTSRWSDFAMYQAWDEGGGHGFMLHNRREQEKTGRRVPQVNEEYGYEDHYPKGWGDNKVAPARAADNRRRLAWGMYMAGGYQTTGERADTGTGWGKDTGGGWINGRGDQSMTMLRGYGRIVDFFHAFEWWRADPHDELVTGVDGAMCLAECGSQYAVYLRAGGAATLKLDGGPYRARRYNPRTGEWHDLPDAAGPSWTSPALPTDGDYAILLQRR